MSIDPPTPITPDPGRAEVDAMQGAVVLEFGTGWCGYCQAAQPLIRQALPSNSSLLHIRIEDGKGKRLGRSFSVKLWPTLIFMRDGLEVSRVVRPTDALTIKQALATILPHSE
ncbi:thioredoxin family protein [Methylobacillus gramineus]|uniref:thioredoxin family protein n=1 Tax=Methylobacillus gramineus TaxID=755169 RepID=UPI001CFF7E23|nr:thioredoxin family protein [Methylobacillus gramineus]MCB5184058.1 thioredoxin family protein [Methylobacillus gramineus]